MTGHRPIKSPGELSVDDLEPLDIIRFHQLIELPQPKQSKQRKREACWQWAGAISGRYGQFKLTLGKFRRALWAHRVSYAIHYGVARAGYEIHHTCGNPWCVNPDHLTELVPDEHDKPNNGFYSEPPPDAPF